MLKDISDIIITMLVGFLIIVISTFICKIMNWKVFCLTIFIAIMSYLLGWIVLDTFNIKFKKENKHE